MSYYEKAYKPGIRRSSREGYVRGIRGRNYPRRKSLYQDPQAQMAPAPIYVLAKTGDLKGMDSDFGSTIGNLLNTTNTNDDIVVANLVRTGNGSYNRVGKKIKMKSLRIFGSVKSTFIPETTTLDVQGNIMRMVVLYDKQPSGVLPTYDTIFGTTVQDGVESTDFLDPLKYDNTGRFQVLKDCRYDFIPYATNNNGGTTDYVEQFINIDEYLKIGRETIYSGDSAPMTIADISSGGLYILFRALNATSNVITLGNDMKCRLRYNDV